MKKKRAQYRVDGAQIVNERGAVLYDLLEDMPVETRQRLADLHTADPDLDWEHAAEILELEGYPLRTPDQK